MIGCGEEEVGRRGGNIAPTTVEVSSRHDELRRQPVTAQIAGAPGMVYPDGQILVDLEMKVGGVHSMVVPDGADELSTRDLLSFPHVDPVEMSIEGVGEPELSVLDPGMSDHDDIAPCDMDVAGQHDQAVSDGMDWLPKASGAAPVRHKPVLAEVSACPEAPGLVVSLAVGGSHGEVESVRGFGNALGKGGAEPPRQKDEEGCQQRLGIP